MITRNHETSRVTQILSLSSARWLQPARGGDSKGMAKAWTVARGQLEIEEVTRGPGSGQDDARTKKAHARHRKSVGDMCAQALEPIHAQKTRNRPTEAPFLTPGHALTRTRRQLPPHALRSHCRRRRTAGKPAVLGGRCHCHLPLPLLGAAATLAEPMPSSPSPYTPPARQRDRHRGWGKREGREEETGWRAAEGGGVHGGALAAGTSVAAEVARVVARARRRQWRQGEEGGRTGCQRRLLRQRPAATQSAARAEARGWRRR